MTFTLPLSLTIGSLSILRSTSDPILMDFDPLEYAGPQLKAAVEKLGGDQLLTAINQIVESKEEYTCGFFDDKWDDLVADEIHDWSLLQLAITGPAMAHAMLDVGLRTYPVDEDDEDYMPDQITGIHAFIRIVLEPEIVADRYELEFENLGDWLMHDAIRFTDGPGEA